MRIQSEANDVVITDDVGVERTLCTCPDPIVASDLTETIEAVGLDWIVPSLNKLPAR